MSRTRNEKTSLPFDLDGNELDRIMDFDDEFNFDSHQRQKGRSPIMAGLKGVGSGVVDHFASMSTIKNLARRILPDGYSTAIDMADEFHSSSHELYDYARKYVRNDVKEFKQSLGRFMTRQDADPDSSSFKYGKKLLDQFRDTSYQGDEEESAVAITMAKIAGIEGERDAAREKRDNIRHSIDRAVEGKRFDDTMGVMVGIHNNIARVVSYNTNYDAAIKRQSLDTSLRQLIVARKTFDLIKTSNEKQLKLLEDVQHNTGLPDAVKLHKKEQAGLMLREYMLNRMGQNAKSFVGAIGREVKNNFKRAFNDTLDSVSGALSAASMGLDAATDAAEFASEFEGGKAGMAGQLIGNWFGDIIGDKIVGPLREKAGKNKNIRAMGLALGRSKNIPQALYDWFNSKERDKGEFDDENYDEFGNEKFTAMLKRSGIAFGRDVFKQFRRDDTVRTEADARQLSASAIWNNRDHIALTQIIPGLIARVHGEVRAMRTNTDPTYIQYDLETGQFQETASITKRIVDNLYGSDNAKDIRGKAHAVIDQIDPNGKLDKATRDKLASFLTKRASEAKGFHLPDLINAQTYGDEFSDKERGRIAGMIRGRFHRPMNRSNYKDILLDEDYQKRMIALGGAYGELQQTVPNIQNDLIGEIQKGNLDALIDTGLVEYVDGKWVAKVDDIHNNMLKGSNQNVGPSDGGSGGVRSKRFHLSNRRGNPGRSIIGRSVQQIRSYAPVGQNREFQEQVESSQALTRRIEELSNSIIDAIVKGYTVDDAKRSADALGEIQKTLNEINGKQFGSNINITRNRNTMNNTMNNRMNNFGQNIMGNVRGKMDSFQTMINEELAKRGINDSTIAAVLGASIAVGARAFSMGGKFKDYIFGKLDKAHELGKKGLSFGLGKIREHGPAVLGGIAKGARNAWDYAFEEAMDVYLKGVKDPIMTAVGFHNGDYYDGESGERLKTHKDIRGEVRDGKNNVILTLQQFAEVGIYTLDGKSRFDKWRDAAKSKLAGIRKSLFEHGGAMKRSIVTVVKETYKEFNFYSDVYVIGESSPRLFKYILQNGGYFQKTSGKVVASYDDLVDDIVDKQNNVVLSTADIAKGLTDNQGKRLRSIRTRVFDTVRNVKAKLDAGVKKLKKFGSAIMAGAKTFKNRLFGLPDEPSDGKAEDISKLSGSRLQARMLREVIQIRRMMQKGTGGGGFTGMFMGDDEGGGDGTSAGPTGSGQKKPGLFGRIGGLFRRKPKAAGEDEGRKGGLFEWRKKRAEEKAAKAGMMGPPKPKAAGGGFIGRLLSGLLRFGPMLAALGGFLFAPILKPLTGLTTILGGLGKILGKGGLLTAGGAALGGLLGGTPGAIAGGALGASASIFGVGKTVGGVARAAGTVARVGFSALRLLPMLANPIVLGAIAIAALAWVGYKAFKYFTAKHNYYVRARFAEYGVDITDEKKAEAVANLEKVCAANVVTTVSGSATLKDSGVPLKEIVEKFGIAPDNNEKQEEWVRWYAERFKPIFLSHVTVIKDITGDANIMDTETRLTAKQKVEVMNRTQFPFEAEGPYSKGWSPWGDNSPIKYGPVDVKNIRKECIEGLQNLFADEEKAKGEKNGRDAENKQKKLAQDTKSYWEGKGVAPWQQKPIDTMTPEERAKRERESAKAQGGDVLTKMRNFSLGSWLYDQFNETASINQVGAIGQAVQHPGNGTGGNINSLPTPTASKGLEAMGPLIVAASKMVGVDPSLALTMANIESGFDSTVKAASSSATGLFQFISGTWKNMLTKYANVFGIHGATPPTDPRANALMGAQFLKDNYSALKSSLKRNPTDTELYLAHFLGSGGAAKLLKLDNNDIPAQTMTDAAKANPTIFFDKGKPRTTRQLVELMDGKVKGKRIPVSQVKGVPEIPTPGMQGKPLLASTASPTVPTSAPSSATKTTTSPTATPAKPNAFAATPVQNSTTPKTVVPSSPVSSPSVASASPTTTTKTSLDLSPLANAQEKATAAANKNAAASLDTQKAQSSSLESIDANITKLLDVMTKGNGGAGVAGATAPRQTNVSDKNQRTASSVPKKQPDSFFDTRV